MTGDYLQTGQVIAQCGELPQRIELLLSVADVRNDVAVDETRIVGRVPDEQERVPTLATTDGGRTESLYSSS